MKDNKYIGIIAAMEEELDAIRAVISNLDEKVIGTLKYYVGSVGETPVVLCQSGVGKSLSAMTATALALNFDLTAVINIGSAGALSKDIHVGDTVVSLRVAQSDFDLTGFGYTQSFDEKRFTFESDEAMIDKMRNLHLDKLHFGDMVSADTFVSKQKHIDHILEHFPTALCADMEAGSIAMVLDKFQIPFIVVRGISDNVVSTDENALEFNEYLKLASKQSAAMTVTLIEAL